MTYDKPSRKGAKGRGRWNNEPHRVDRPHCRGGPALERSARARITRHTRGRCVSASHMGSSAALRSCYWTRLAFDLSPE